MEVTARIPVLYNGGLNRKHHVRLDLCAAGKNTTIAGEKLRITFGAGIDRSCRSDWFTRLLPGGVELPDGQTRSFPFIRVRGVNAKGKTDLTKIFLSVDEEAHLRGEFGLTPEAMAGAFFRFVPPLGLNPVHVAPAWSELMAPKWENALRNWVREPERNPIPWPESFPWTAQKCHGLFLPGVTELVPYPVDKAKGELRFALVDGAPQAVFVRETKSQNISAFYPLAWDGEEIIASLLEVK